MFDVRSTGDHSWTFRPHRRVGVDEAPVSQVRSHANDGTIRAVAHERGALGEGRQVALLSRVESQRHRHLTRLVGRLAKEPRGLALAKEPLGTLAMRRADVAGG